MTQTMNSYDEPLQAVIYCRVSSAKQAEEGQGLESQETRCLEYANRKKYGVIGTFADSGISGGALDRPGMRSLLAFLLKQPDEEIIVIIDDLSRFSRDVIVHWQLKSLLEKAGGRLESPTMTFGDTSDDQLIENLLASVSQHQRQKNAEQVKHRMRARVMNGYWVFHSPIGYKYIQTKGQGKVLIRDEPVASIIQEALEGYASGRFETQTEVQRYLESQPEFPAQLPNGGIRLQKVTDILTNPVYAGCVLSKIWDVSLRKGHHEGLISLETFDKIQARRASGAVAPARKDINEDFPLRGFVTCGGCETPLRSCWSKSSTGKRYPYYLCQTKACESYGKSIRRDKIEGEFKALLSKLSPSEGMFLIVKDMLYAAWNQRLKQANEVRKSLRRDMLKLENQINGFLERIVDASSSTAVKAYERKIDQLEKSKLLASEKLEKSFQPKATPAQMLELSMKFLSNPCKIWDSGNINLQKMVLRLAFSERLAYCRNEGYRTPKTTLPFNVLRGICGDKREMVPWRRLELPLPCEN